MGFIETPYRKVEEGAPDQIGSPLQGALSKMLVKSGQEVKKNDPLFVIEAMKMETIVTSLRDQKVREVVLGEVVLVLWKRRSIWV